MIRKGDDYGKGRHGMVEAAWGLPYVNPPRCRWRLVRVEWGWLDDPVVSALLTERSTRRATVKL